MIHFPTIVLVSDEYKRDIIKKLNILLTPYMFKEKTINEKGRFAYWEIGGKYDGEINGNLQVRKEFVDVSEAWLINNMTMAYDICDKYLDENTDICILTLDSIWHERRDNQSEENWLVDVRDLLRKQRESIAILCEMSF